MKIRHSTAARVAAYVSFASLILSGSIAAAGTSKLWGTDGGAWDPRGRLPEFSYAGYRGGGVALPQVPVVVNVRDFGAVGDGEADDTLAFQNAINAAADGAILVPRGRYRITDVLRIQKSRIVLRGEGSGPEGSVLFFTRSLTDVLGPNENWSWSGGLVWIDGGVVSEPGTVVVAEASRGDTSLRVADASQVSPGALMTLRLLDDGQGSLGLHLHAGQSKAGDCPYMVPLVFEWPVRVSSVAGDEVVLAQPLRTDVRLGWGPEVRSVKAIEEVGVEHLRIEFVETPRPEHLLELGYNAISFNNGVADSWVRDVQIVNADSGIFTETLVKNVTLREVEISGRGGHHGVAVSLSADVLVEDVKVGGPWQHSLTVTHRANGTVFSRVNGAEALSLDHHGDIPFETLFTEIGAHNWTSSGSACALPHAGARNTYWNLAGPMYAPQKWSAMQTNVVGELVSAESLTETSEWFENVLDLEPANLYEAQLGRRLCGEFINACNQARFDAAEGACVAVPRADGTPCGEGGLACHSGVCPVQAETGGCAVRAAGFGLEGGAFGLGVLVGLGALARRRSRR